MAEWTCGSGILVQLTDDVEKERLTRKLERTMQQAKAKVEEVHSAYTLGVALHACGVLLCGRAEPLINNAATEILQAAGCDHGLCNSINCIASLECRGVVGEWTMVSGIWGFAAKQRYQAVVREKAVLEAENQELQQRYAQKSK